jgi:K+-transporting ATPase ATPase A chain
MNTEILGIILMYGLVIAIAIPFGKYLSKVLSNEKTWLDSNLSTDREFHL